MKCRPKVWSVQKNSDFHGKIEKMAFKNLKRKSTYKRKEERTKTFSSLTIKDLDPGMIERVKREMPEDLEGMSDLCKERYILCEAARITMDESPNRWYTFVVETTGKTETIDLKHLNYKGMIRKLGGSREQEMEAKEIRDYFVNPLIFDYGFKKRAYLAVYQKEKDAFLPPDIEVKMIKLFGEFNSVDDVKKIVHERHHVHIGYKELLRFFAKHKAEIDAKRASFLTTTNEYKIATEAGRLQILNTILVDLQLRYTGFMEKGSIDKALVFSREIRNILEQARKEVKGNELKLTVDGRIDITATLHGQENVDRVMRTLPINSIVIGIVAAKNNIDPAVLVAQLASSYYKDFNGFNRNILGREKIMLPGDIIRAQMDWKQLAGLNARFLDEMRPMPVEDAPYVEVKRKETAKERLERLKKIAETVAK